MKPPAPRLWLLLQLLLGLLSGCATRPVEPLSHPLSTAIPPAQDSRLVRWLQAPLAAHPGESGTRLLSDGLEALQARLDAIDAADSSIDLQLYIFREDNSGSLVSARLLAAADRGVRLRLLLDDLGESPNEADLRALDRHPHIEVRLFNPVMIRRGPLRLLEMLGFAPLLNRRMHNKLLLVDSLLLITGGRNIGDEYFRSGPVQFRDLDVLAAGPIAPEAARSFDSYWNSEFAVPLATLDTGDSQLSALRQRLQTFDVQTAHTAYRKALRDTPMAEEFRKRRLRLHFSPVELFADPPEKLNETVGIASPDYVGPRLIERMQALKQELVVISAYFVPGDAGVARMQSLTAQGVKVAVLTNSLASTDVALAHSGYVPYRKALLEAGTELHELKPIPLPTPIRRRERRGNSSRASLHAKTFIFDRRSVFIGSVNMDPRSLEQNTELGLYIKNAEQAAQVHALYQQFIKPSSAWRVTCDDAGRLLWLGEKDGQPLRLNTEPGVGFWQRLGTRLLSWLPLESQL